jgi:hypothetical protein
MRMPISPVGHAASVGVHIDAFRWMELTNY